MERGTRISFKSVDDFISAQPEEDRNILQQLRKIIKDAAPGAEEVISYQMPAFRYHGMVAWYAVYRNHYALYPTARAINEFREQLKPYEVSKGTIRFPRNQAIPARLISDIVRSQVMENLSKGSSGKKKNAN